MLEIIWLVFLFLVSFYVLLKSSDVFTESAEDIGLWLKISPFVVGVTIVAFGTSLPELISSIFAIWSGAPQIVAGNAIGSNVANILLVLGVSAVVAGKLVLKQKLRFLVFSTIFIILTCIDGEFTRIEALIGVLLLIYYIWTLRPVADSSSKHVLAKNTILYFVLSGIGVFIGAKYVVDSLLGFAAVFSIDAGVLAAILLAIGTSLPELSVSLVALKKKKGEMAIGNILGSNIFNAAMVLGLPGLFVVLPVVPAVLYVMVPALLISTALLVLFARDHTISRREGIIFLLLYVAVIILTFLF